MVCQKPDAETLLAIWWTRSSARQHVVCRAVQPHHAGSQLEMAGAPVGKRKHVLAKLEEKSIHKGNR